MLRVEAMLIRTSPPPLLRLSVVLSKPVGTGWGPPILRGGLPELISVINSR